MTGTKKKVQISEENGLLKRLGCSAAAVEDIQGGGNIS